MKQLNVVNFTIKRDNYGIPAHHSPAEENCAKFRDIRLRKTVFNKKYFLPKNGKEIWKVAHRILKPNDNTLKVDTNRLKYFNDTAARLVSRKSMNKKELTSPIDSVNGKENYNQLHMKILKSV